MHYPMQWLRMVYKEKSNYSKAALIVLWKDSIIVYYTVWMAFNLLKFCLDELWNESLSWFVSFNMQCFKKVSLL